MQLAVISDIHGNEVKRGGPFGQMLWLEVLTARRTVSALFGWLKQRHREPISHDDWLSAAHDFLDFTGQSKDLRH